MAVVDQNGIKAYTVNFYDNGIVNVWLIDNHLHNNFLLNICNEFDGGCLIKKYDILNLENFIEYSFIYGRFITIGEEGYSFTFDLDNKFVKNESSGLYYKLDEAQIFIIISLIIRFYKTKCIGYE